MAEINDIDFDKLNSIEREHYLKTLELVETSKITLEDFKKHIHGMRQAIENSLVDEPEYIYSSPFPFLKRSNPKILELKARLKNYLIFEAFFDRPDRAREILETYKKRLQ